MPRRRPIHLPTASMVLLLAASLLASCSSTGTANPEPTPAWSAYESDRYGYRIGLPSGWKVEQQGGIFDPFIKNNLWSIGIDTLASPGSNRLSYDGAVAIGAAPIPAGMSLADFTKRVSGAYPCRPPVAQGDGLLGGEPSREVEYVCVATSWIQVTAIHDGRGYVMWLGSKKRPFVSSRPITRQFIDSFAFVD